MAVKPDHGMCGSSAVPGRFHQGVGPAETSTFYRYWKQAHRATETVKTRTVFAPRQAGRWLIPDGVAR